VQCPESSHCWAGTVTLSEVIDTDVDGSTSKENNVTTVTVNGAGTIVEHESPTGETVFGGEMGKGTASLDSESRALNAHCAPDGAEGTYVSTLVGSVDGDGRVLVLPNDDAHPTSLTLAATVDTNIPTTSTDNCNSFSRSTGGPGGGFTWQAVIDVPAGWDGLHLHDTYSEPIPGYAAATTTAAKWTITWDLTRKARPGCPATSFLDAKSCPVAKPAPLPSNAFSLVGNSARQASAGVWTVTLRVPGPGSLSFDQTIAGTPRLVGPGKAIATKTGQVRFTLTPTVAGKTRLKTAAALNVTLKVTFSPRGGKPATRAITLTLTR
jgi:hypothetical protein